MDKRGAIAGTSQVFTETDGSQIIKFSFTENFVGAMGRFKGVRRRASAAPTRA